MLRTHRPSAANRTVFYASGLIRAIKPHWRFGEDRHTLADRLSDAVIEHGGPHAVFMNDDDGPWGAAGIFPLSPDQTIGEAWVVWSYAMYRNRHWFTHELISNLGFYSQQFKTVYAHYDPKWPSAIEWAKDKLGFELAGDGVDANQPGSIRLVKHYG